MPASNILQFPFTGGLQQGKDPIHVTPDELLVAENVRHTKAGSLQRRNGTALVASTLDGAAFDAASKGRVATFKDEVIVITGGALATHSAARGTLVTRGKVPEAMIDVEDAIGINDVSAPGATYSACYQDMAEGGGYRCTIWNSYPYGGLLTFVTTDLTTGAIVSKALVYVGTGICRVLYLDAVFVIVYSDYNGGAGTNIFAVVHDPALGTTSAPSALTTARTAGSAFEVCTYGSVFVLFYLTTANYQPTIRAFSSTLVPPAAAVVMADAALTTKTGFGISGTAGESIVISYCTAIGGNYGVRYGVFNAATYAVTSGPTTVQTGAVGVFIPFITAPARISATSYGIAYSAYDNLSVHSTSFAVVTTAGVISIAGTLRKTNWAMLAAKPFVNGGKLYAWLACGSAKGTGKHPIEPVSEWTLELCDSRATEATVHASGQMARPVGTATARFGQAPISAPYDCTLPSVTRSTTAPITLLKERVDNQGVNAFRYVETTFGDERLFAPAEIANVLALSGGCPSIYDGERVYEHGFIYDIQGHVSAPSANLGGGALVPADQYAYLYMYVFIDRAGQAHYGATSAISSYITVGGGHNSISLTIPTLCVTQKQTADESFFPSVSIWIFRTDYTGGVAGEVPYFLAAVANDPTVGTVNYDDKGQVTNANLIKRAPAYTYGGRVAGRCPPAFRHITTHKGRLFGITKNALWYTTEATAGEIPRFADEQTIPIDTAELMGVDSLDDKLAIFDQDQRLFYLPGDGPIDTGAENDYRNPIPVSCDVGLRTARSLVRFPGGIMFQSDMGLIYMLSRSLEIRFIGKPVESDSTLPCRGAVLNRSEQTVSFCFGLQNANKRIVYDYLADRWVTDTLPTDTDGLAASTRGLFWIAPNGTLYKESTAQALDLGAWFTAKVRAGHLNLAQGTQGQQRIRTARAQLTRTEDCGVTVRVYVDYKATVDNTKSVSSVAGFASTFELEATVVTARNKAVSIEIQDVAPASLVGNSGRGCAFTSIAFDVSPEKGPNRLPSAQKG